jgi:hypothetical protein
MWACSPLQGEFWSLSSVWLRLRESWRLWLRSLVFICLGLRGSMVFAIEKACILVAALLSLELIVCHPYSLV